MFGMKRKVWQMRGTPSSIENTDLSCHIARMCNSYRITPKRGVGTAIHGKVSALAEGLASALVRKSDPGIVVLAGEQVELMRWGFHRNFNPSINNARSDKLDTGIWKSAFRERRCTIPVSGFYEWGPGVGGRKQAHEFRDPGDDYLWIAGLWEEHPDLGRCYSMITTDASPLMAPIHKRMPAVLLPDEAMDFLEPASGWDFRPFGGDLIVERCESPLKKPRGGASQAELF